MFFFQTLGFGVWGIIWDHFQRPQIDLKVKNSLYDISLDLADIRIKDKPAHLAEEATMAAAARHNMENFRAVTWEHVQDETGHDWTMLQLIELIIMPCWRSCRRTSPNTGGSGTS